MQIKIQLKHKYTYKSNYKLAKSGKGWEQISTLKKHNTNKNTNANKITKINPESNTNWSKVGSGEIQMYVYK